MAKGSSFNDSEHKDEREENPHESNIGSFEANNKQFARLKVLQTVIAAVERRLEQEE